MALSPKRINGLAIVYLPRAALVPHPTNARRHTPAELKHLVRSMKTYGWTNPIIIDEHHNVLAGHGRMKAAEALGIDEVPTICISHMTAAQKRAYIIADNRLAEISGSWDKRLLASEHQAIQLMDPEFDLTETGFELGDIHVLLDNLLGCEEDTPPSPDRERPSISQLGDVWQLGPHRLACGSALDGSVYKALLQGEKAEMVITDPPYNVPVNGHVVRKGKHREFVMGSAEMSSEQFRGLLTAAFGLLIAFTADGSIHFLFIDWRHLPEMIEATAQYTEFKNLVFWNKSNAGLGSFYRSKHELVFVMKNGTMPHINNFGLGEKGRHRSNVWDYPGQNSFGQSRTADLEMHPTVKPIAMFADAMKDCSRKNGIILDSFGGSGTTIMAAEATGRRARLIELDPAYVDVSIRRWQADTGGKAILCDDGRSFDEIEKEGR